jgi:hypothetical protein
MYVQYYSIFAGEVSSRGDFASTSHEIYQRLFKTYYNHKQKVIASKRSFQPFAYCHNCMITFCLHNLSCFQIIHLDTDSIRVETVEIPGNNTTTDQRDLGL